MKFKEIKPGMVIHCPKEEDARTLLEHLDYEGYEWFPSGKLMENIRWERYQSGSLYCIDLGGKTVVLNNMYVERPSCATPPTEFSDLIEPDDSPIDSPMTAAEVLEWLKAMPNETLDYVFGYDSLDEIFRNKSVNEIIGSIAEFEVEVAKKPKPMEVEWINLCRIIQTRDDGTKQVVYEENLKPETPFDTDPDLKEQTEAILKKYTLGHDGRYMAVIENICRVKED